MVTKFSQISAGGVLVPSTDQILAVRNGTTDVLVTFDTNLKLGEIGKGFDNGSSVINTGQAVGYTVCPFGGTITGWQIIGSASGSIVIDVWKVAAGSIPTSANSIVASAPPTLSSAQQATSSTLTGWTTSVAVGDVFAFSVTSVSTLTHADLFLFVTKS